MYPRQDMHCIFAAETSAHGQFLGPEPLTTGANAGAHTKRYLARGDVAEPHRSNALKVATLLSVVSPR